MEPIKINDDQKNKLLEMCRTLFPEYKKIELFYPSNAARCKNLFFYKDPADVYTGYCDLEIGWFEFCITYLGDKIPGLDLTLIVIRALSSLSLSINTYEHNHPIDYLYEEFKKLK